MERILLIILLCSSTLWAQSYSLEDLEILAEEESHEEFFAHAMDIRPSERQDTWKAMVTKMGDSYGRKVLQKSEITRKDFQKLEELITWPGLKTDDIFKSRRQEAGLRYLRKCLKETSPCWNDLVAFWEKDKTDADMAFKLAELTGPLENSPLSTWSFLEVALKSPLSEFYCKKEFAMTALWGKIEMDYVKLGPDGDLMTQIDKTVHPDCLPILISEAQKRLYTPPKPFDRELAFQVLKSQSKAGQEITDFFYTVYLLDNPSKGELFNYSWNRVKDLGNSAERREKVLEKLRKLDPLPDQIITTMDEAKRRVVLKHFKSNFPEYLDLYTGECLNYYGGKATYPSGNPTVHCQKLMESEIAPEIIPEWRIKNYQEVRKI
jgi:hypothetical protein